MKLSRKEKPNVLELFFKKQEKVELSKFEAAFTFNYKIVVKMKRVILEILQKKEIAYKLDTFDRSQNDKKVIVDRFQLFFLEDVELKYYKYTFLSKKELYYVANATHIATIEIINDKKCDIFIRVDEFFEDIKKVSHNLNEYFDTTIILGYNHHDHLNNGDIDNIYCKKESIDTMDKNSYCSFGSLNFCVKDIIATNNLEKIERFYLPSTWNY